MEAPNKATVTVKVDIKPKNLDRTDCPRMRGNDPVSRKSKKFDDGLQDCTMVFDFYSKMPIKPTYEVKERKLGDAKSVNVEPIVYGGGDHAFNIRIQTLLLGRNATVTFSIKNPLCELEIGKFHNIKDKADVELGPMQKPPSKSTHHK